MHDISHKQIDYMPSTYVFEFITRERGREVQSERERDRERKRERKFITKPLINLYSRFRRTYATDIGIQATATCLKIDGISFFIVPTNAMKR